MTGGNPGLTELDPLAVAKPAGATVVMVAAF